MVRKALVALLLMEHLAAAQPAQQQWVVVVAEPVTLGIDPESASTFADLVRLELAKQAPVTVIPRTRTPPDPCGDSGCAVGLAQRAQASAAFVSTLSRLGDRVVVK